MTTVEMILAFAGMFFASSGFWMVVNNVYQNRSKRVTAERKALLGLLHERLVDRCTDYIARGFITHQEYEDLRKYIYEPYKALEGNGTGDKLMEAVDKIEFR